MKNITVITKNFGENFTGATLATCKYLKALEHKFDHIEVFCLHTGKHTLDKGQVHPYSGIWALFFALRKAAKKNNDTLYLSDDHFGFILKFLSLPYTHIYHGNWPNAMTINVTMFLKSFYFIPLYALTILFAKTVVHVSYFMEHTWRALNSRTVIIRNGIRDLSGQAKTKKADSNVLHILMVGNIDKRKYGYAPELFRLLAKTKDPQKLHVDIYGNSLDAGIAKKISQYPFVHVKGFQPDFSFKDYDVFLSLSSGENLSIAICEALGSEVPVVCFNVGGLIEVVKNGENGFLVSKGKIMEVADLLDKISDKKYNFIFREHDLREFSWDVSANRLYNTLTESRP